jgi:hypothetical protein
MTTQEGFRRLPLLSVVLAYCSLGGLFLWLIQALTISRWGIVELLVLALAPILLAAGLRIVTWLLEGFFQSPRPHGTGL